MAILKERRFWLFMGFSVIIFLVMVGRVDEEEKALPFLGELTEFQLTDQNGEQFSRDDLLGKVWVADFIFTTCAGPCPIMSGQLQNSNPDSAMHLISVFSPSLSILTTIRLRY